MQWTEVHICLIGRHIIQTCGDHDTARKEGRGTQVLTSAYCKAGMAGRQSRRSEEGRVGRKVRSGRSEGTAASA